MEKSCRKTTLFFLLLTALFFVSFNFAHASRSDAEKYNKQGKEAFQAKRYDEALKMLELAIKADPTFAPAHVTLAEIYMSFEKPKEAIAEYSRAIEIDPNNPASYVRLGELYLGEKDFEKAIDNLTKAKKIAPSVPQIYLALGQTYFEMKEYGKAEENLVVLLQMPNASDEEKLKAHKQLGELYYEKKEWKKASENFKTILESDKASENFKATIEDKNKYVNNQLSTQKIQFFGIIAMVVVLVLLAVFSILLKKQQGGKTQTVLPSSASDAKDYGSLANYAVQHLKVLTKLPRALVYFMRREGSPLYLALADNLEKDRFDDLEINWEELSNWLTKNQGRPFIYNIEKKEPMFLKAFPKLRERIDPAEPRVGVPFLYQNQFRGIIFMASPKMKDMIHLRKFYEKNIEMIRKTGVEIGNAAEKIYHREISVLDSITPAYNQIHYKEKLPEELTKCRDKKQSLCLVLFEIDRMVAIQKRFGDERKNYVLATIAKSVQAAINPQTDSLFRISDFLFACILPNTDQKSGVEKASNLMQVIASTRFTSPIPSVSASMGLAVYPDQGNNAPAVEQEARKMLEQAISTGRNKLMSEMDSAVGSGFIKEAPAPPPTQADTAKTGAGSSDNPPSQIKFRNVDKKATIPVAPPPPQEEKTAPFTTIKNVIPVAPPPADDERPQPIVTPQIQIQPQPLNPMQPQPIVIKEPPSSPAGRLGKPSLVFRSAQKTQPELPKAAERMEPLPGVAPPKSVFNPAAESDSSKDDSGKEKFLKPRMVSKTEPGKSGALPKAVPDFVPMPVPEAPKMVEPVAPKAPAAPPPWMKEKAFPKKDESREMSETSLLRRPPKMREVGSSTSKLPPLPKSAEGVKPMEGLIRRSKAPAQLPGLKRRIAATSLKPLTVQGPDGLTLAPEAMESGKLREPVTSHMPEPEVMAPPASKVPPAVMPQKIGAPPQAKPEPRVIQRNAATPALPERKASAPDSGRVMAEIKPPVAPRTAGRAPITSHIGTAPLPKLGMKSFKPEIPGKKEDDAEAQAALMKKKAQAAAARDPVTQFFYKSYFEQSLKNLMARANQNKRPLALIFFKLDKHKEIKGKHGQDKLNNVLKEISLMVGNFLKEGSDIPARYSDEIFVVILPDTSFQIAFNLAEQIRFTVGNLGFKEVPGQITLSLGIASYPNKGKSSSEVMKNSYDAMVYAIKSGGNSSVIWDEKLLKRKD
ncbi:MAG: diguanylate cyclase [Firmicutes bacterium]|nr:diguanylate cyclase [Bacillota bacterium]